MLKFLLSSDFRIRPSPFLLMYVVLLWKVLVSAAVICIDLALFTRLESSLIGPAGVLRILTRVRYVVFGSILRQWVLFFPL